ncbi:MAG TPA: phosphoribosyltransferase [Candidatus Saccharimonadales bacterium]|nr:phosphoribosyltransferase [Candidatus Saccharimonadales bacterium]
MHDGQVVTLDRFNDLLDAVIGNIQADNWFVPDTILALSTGGFPVAAALAKRLGIASRNVVGLPVYKDEHNDYHLDDRIVSLGDCAGRQILVVDEASNRGLLTGKAVDAVIERGGIAKSCVLIAWEGGVQPDFVAETCSGKPPKFYWEPVAS